MKQMKHILSALIIGAFTVGCGSKEEEASAPSPAPAPSMPALSTPAAPPSPAPGVAGSTASPVGSTPGVATADIPVDLEALSKGVLDFCKKTMLNPESVEEVARAGYIKTLPKLPPGKKLEIDRDTYKVIIVDK